MHKEKSARATVSVTDAARQLGIGRNQAYEAAARGELPTIRIGKRILVPKAALARLLQQAPQEAA
jgi:excisionase family DNA binding protein